MNPLIHVQASVDHEFVELAYRHVVDTMKLATILLKAKEAFELYRQAAEPLAVLERVAADGNDFNRLFRDLNLAVESFRALGRVQEFLGNMEAIREDLKKLGSVSRTIQMAYPLPEPATIGGSSDQAQQTKEVSGETPNDGIPF